MATFHHYYWLHNVCVCVCVCLFIWFVSIFYSCVLYFSQKIKKIVSCKPSFFVLFSGNFVKISSLFWMKAMQVKNRFWNWRWGKWGQEQNQWYTQFSNLKLVNEYRKNSNEKLKEKKTIPKMEMECVLFLDSQLKFEKKIKSHTVIISFHFFFLSKCIKKFFEPFVFVVCLDQTGPVHGCYGLFASKSRWNRSNISSFFFPLFLKHFFFLFYLNRWCVILMPRFLHTFHTYFFCFFFVKRFVFGFFFLQNTNTWFVFHFCCCCCFFSFWNYFFSTNWNLLCRSVVVIVHELIKFIWTSFYISQLCHLVFQIYFLFSFIHFFSLYFFK